MLPPVSKFVSDSITDIIKSKKEFYWPFEQDLKIELEDGLIYLETEPVITCLCERSSVSFWIRFTVLTSSGIDTFVKVYLYRKKAYRMQGATLELFRRIEPFGLTLDSWFRQDIALVEFVSEANNVVTLRLKEENY
jgi:hypothetical protein